MPELPDFKAGQVLSAAAMTAIAQELARQGKIVGTPPVDVGDGEDGISISVDVPDEFWIKLDGGGAGGLYDWHRVVGDFGGIWIDSPDGDSGTGSADPAIEENGRDDVPLSPETVFLAKRDPYSGSLFFSGGVCP